MGINTSPVTSMGHIIMTEPNGFRHTIALLHCGLKSTAAVLNLLHHSRLCLSNTAINHAQRPLPFRLRTKCDGKLWWQKCCQVRETNASFKRNTSAHALNERTFVRPGET